MEESKERKERLRLMRAKADQAENSKDSETTLAMPFHLSNPLIETSAATPPQEPSRFDFYTDPMAAFTANKKRNTESHHVSLDHYTHTPPINSGSPMLRAPYPVPGPRAEMTPIAHQFQGSYFLDQGNLGPSNGPGSTMGYNFPGVQPRGHNFQSPRFGPMGSPFNTGRGGSGNRWQGNSLSHGSGRRGGGGGRGMGGRFSTMERPLGPERFSHSSMIEDPWKFLTPVTWKGVDAPLSRLYTSEASRSSFEMHKTKVDNTPKNVSSQPSLAEYLAASFDEAANDASNT
ncbi:hypothetical protein F8388_024024 [Cannabis sativa]|uniref:Uncharacterized protein n=1 Tax=Cannabis sativa TaxID=3483 RepID=A0A7J6FX82_CANSA|nr:hypothetical protein G4B88_021971 [Cannabis sativa]KAF4375365.1 hypothetical protein F8388_024024 [Cannabis sativa]